jgi:hypothetical protein
MLLLVKELQYYTIQATDGEIGHLEQLYFDDETWAIKYAVIDVGHWLSGRQVLISPTAIIEVNAIHKTIHLSLTKEQIEKSLDICTHKPVARQHPTDYSIYFGWPYYWGLTGLDATVGYPSGGSVGTDSEARRSVDTTSDEENDAHLRSTDVVGGYHIMALDGEIGHIENFIVDDQTWTIRYAVADTKNWWPGKKVLLATEWILWVSWAESNTYVSLARELITSAPEFDPALPLTRDYELRLYAHYKRSPYWEQKRDGQSEVHSKPIPKNE